MNKEKREIQLKRSIIEDYGNLSLDDAYRKLNFIKNLKSIPICEKHMRIDYLKSKIAEKISKPK